MNLKSKNLDKVKIKKQKEALTELLKNEDALSLGEALANVLQADEELGES